MGSPIALFVLGFVGEEEDESACGIKRV